MENANAHGMPYSYMNLVGIYRGEIENGVPHGLGDYTYDDENDATNNIRINGTWQDGVLISGTRYQGDAGDECVFTGFFHANGQVREGTMTFRGGVEFHGTFHEDGDFKHGRMTNLGIDGNGWYEGDFVNGVRNGTGELHNDGVVFTGTWRDDFLHGKGTMVLPNGTRYDGMWNDHHFDGSIFYSNGVRREFIGYLQYIGGKAVGHSEEMSVTDSRHHLTYKGDFEDTMPKHFGSVTWFSNTKEFEELFNLTLPVFSDAFHSFCIVSPSQHKTLIDKEILVLQEDPVSCELVDLDVPLFYLFHFGLKLDQTDDVQFWHPMDISVAMKHRRCPFCRLEYPQPLRNWIAATNIQRFVRSMIQNRNRHGGTKRSGTKRSGTKRSGTKRSGTKRSGTKRSGTNKRKNKRNAQRRC
jgi:hypothetical protein